MSIEQEIKDVELQLARLKSQREELILKQNEPTQDVKQIAMYIHDCTCKSNHTDQCGWFYEVNNDVHNWQSRTHRDFAKKATKLISVAGSVAEAVTMLHNYTTIEQL